MIVIIIIVIFIIIFVVLFWQISTLISLYGGVPFVASKSGVIKKALEMAKIKGGEIFYELGSGIGTGLLIASKEFKVKSVGIEISPFYYLVSLIKTKKDKKIKVICGNFKKINLSKADVVYCYLFPGLMQKLLPKFRKELRSGSRVVSYVFLLPQLKPDSIKDINGKKIYLYRF